MTGQSLAPECCVTPGRLLSLSDTKGRGDLRVGLQGGGKIPVYLDTPPLGWAQVGSVAIPFYRGGN